MMHSNRSTNFLTAGLSCRGILLQENGGSIYVWLNTFIPTTDGNNLRQISSVTPTLDPKKSHPKSKSKIDGAIQRSSTHALTYGCFSENSR